MNKDKKILIASTTLLSYKKKQIIGNNIEAVIEASDTYFVNLTTTNMYTSKPMAINGLMPITIPPAVATPLPPLNPRVKG